MRYCCGNWTQYHFVHRRYGQGRWVSYGAREWPSRCVWIVPGTISIKED